MRRCRNRRFAVCTTRSALSVLVLGSMVAVAEAQPSYDVPEIGDPDELGEPPPPPPDMTASGQPQAPPPQRARAPDEDRKPQPPQAETKPPSARRGQATPERRPQSDRECVRECRRAGACRYVDGECRATDDVHCTQAEVCRDEGRCSVRAGRCEATTEDDCWRSKECVDDGRCALDPAERRCVARGPDRANRGLMAGGIVMISVGAGAALLFGVPAIIIGSEGEGLHTGGMVAAVLGGLSVAAGIPMTAVGGRRTDDSDEDSFDVSVRIGPTSAGLQVRF